MMSATGCIKKYDGTVDREVFDHDGIARKYILYRPQNIEPNAPLVFLLHGYLGTDDHAMNTYGMNEVADANGFAVCYPQGSKDDSGINHWNAGLTISDRDDVGFLTQLAQFLQSEYRLDVNRTFSCGMSNGGFMSYHLACEAPDVFRAIASVTGTMSGSTWSDCTPSDTIPILQIHGIDDTTVPIDGSMTTDGGWGGAPQLDSVVAAWSQRNLCTTFDTTFLPNSTTRIVHSDCFYNHQVWYHKIDDWGHAWPKENDHTGSVASELIWEFFGQY
jgi:polyhydroxybutyrate depolymerase